MSLDFADYQAQASRTQIYDDADVVVYPSMGLFSEAGEVSGLIKKIMRDQGGQYFLPENRVEIGKELGDVLWYISALCTDLNLNLSDVASDNLTKLNSRLARGVLGGSGDNR
jgi:NTP pyrophosphatase (non-canonical NTP hydrolase)